MAYKLNQNSTSITRISDGASIPADPQNTDYAEYQKWVAKGNVPTPGQTPAEITAAIIASTNATADRVIATQLTESFPLILDILEAMATGADKAAIKVVNNLVKAELAKKGKV